MKDFDEWAVERRVRQSNRKWLAKEIVKISFFIAGLILVFTYFFGN